MVQKRNRRSQRIAEYMKATGSGSNPASIVPSSTSVVSEISNLHQSINNIDLEQFQVNYQIADLKNK